MKLGIIIYSTVTEAVWNGFRLGNFALERGDQVKIFLLAAGVDCEGLSTERFNISGQMQTFVNDGGEILACGTCLKIRNKTGTDLCPLSSMADLYEIISKSDKTISI